MTVKIYLFHIPALILLYQRIPTNARI